MDFSLTLESVPRPVASIIAILWRRSPSTAIQREISMFDWEKTRKHRAENQLGKHMFRTDCDLSLKPPTIYMWVWTHSSSIENYFRLPDCGETISRTLVTNTWSGSETKFANDTWRQNRVQASCWICFLDMKQRALWGLRIIFALSCRGISVYPKIED